MSIQQQQAHFNQKVTLLNDSKFRLYGDLLEGNQPGRLPFMFVNMHNNYPRLRVVLNNGKKGEEGTINLNLDLPTYMNFLVALEEAIKSKEPTSIGIEVKRVAFDQATRKPKEPYTYAIIVVGKNADGVEYIGIQRGQPNGRNYAKCTFYFTTPEFHPLIDLKTMAPLSRPESSRIIAKGYLKLMQLLVPLINAHTWDYNQTQEAKRNDKNGISRDGNPQSNNGYSNNTSYSKPAPAPAPASGGFNDDELPW